MDRLLKRAELLKLTGLTRYMADLLETEADFPKRIKVGRRAVYWSECAVAAYLAQLMDHSPRSGGA